MQALLFFPVSGMNEQKRKEKKRKGSSGPAERNSGLLLRKSLLHPMRMSEDEKASQEESSIRSSLSCFV